MKKKILLCLCCAVVLVSCFAPLATSAAPSTLQVAWLSNRISGDNIAFELILPSYASSVYTDLEPNTNYYMEGCPFRTDANGRIPSGVVTFVAYGYVWTVYDRGYYYTVETDQTSSATFWEGRPNTNFVIVASDGDSDTEYDAGFNAGKLAGIEIGFAQGYDSGYSAGYVDGREEGYDVGYSDGLDTADTGDWRSLFTSVVEAPLSVLYGILDFEILGFDLKNAFGAVLVLCVVIIVVKAVV